MEKAQPLQEVETEEESRGPGTPCAPTGQVPGSLHKGSRQHPQSSMIKAAVAQTGHQEALQSQLSSSGPEVMPQGPGFR